ncbi:arsenate reductase (glutaredoxin) [Marinihelvus fidelis]|uniref:Arsenate reductase n=1 Tax=Marinihelvus fidelis TaxID=2613842 RepID=A0A5N0T705_9GAMM|nr:arsenate reductase (glutaredoxin) [Marinihelvus fidelis]KAA9129596.1 arsenate reductase (glutaredoxin) [Marinihelvus fidelis]
MTVTIYHNPRCSKSRATLALLEDRGIEPDIVRYLDTPPDAATLKQLVAMLGISPRELLRRGEQEYRDLGLASAELDDDAIIAAMASHPRLIERPIVTHDGKAAIGRPPESVLDIL